MRTIPFVTSLSKSLIAPLAAFGALGLAAALLLAGLDSATEDRIKAERRDHALRAVSSMLDAVGYDNDLLESGQEVDIHHLGDVRIYTARLQGRPTAIVADVTTPGGYSGDIRLLVALDTEGSVLGVRVLEHRETPGLGDRIEREKSDWVEQFGGKSLGSPPADKWAPDRRGGEFDTVTSATISSAAVIDAVRRVLQALQSNRDEWLAGPDVTDTWNAHD